MQACIHTRVHTHAPGGPHTRLEPHIWGWRVAPKASPKPTSRPPFTGTQAMNWGLTPTPPSHLHPAPPSQAPALSPRWDSAPIPSSGSAPHPPVARLCWCRAHPASWGPGTPGAGPLGSPFPVIPHPPTQLPSRTLLGLDCALGQLARGALQSSRPPLCTHRLGTGGPEDSAAVAHSGSFCPTDHTQPSGGLCTFRTARDPGPDLSHSTKPWAPGWAGPAPTRHRQGLAVDTARPRQIKLGGGLGCEQCPGMHAPSAHGAVGCSLEGEVPCRRPGGAAP